MFQHFSQELARVRVERLPRAPRPRGASEIRLSVRRRQQR